MKNKIVSGIKNVVIFIIIFSSYILPFSVNWIYNNFGNVGLEEIAFQIAVPMNGANTDYYFNYAKNALIYIILCTIATYTVITLIFRKRIKKYQPKRMKVKNRDNNSLIVYKKFRIDKKFIGKLICSTIVFVLSINYTINRTS